VQRGQAVLGRFDAEGSSLVAAGRGGRAFVFSPRDAAAGAQLAALTVGRQITALAAGAILPNSVREVLLIGSSTAVQCYDIERNRLGRGRCSSGPVLLGKIEAGLAVPRGTQAMHAAHPTHPIIIMGPALCPFSGICVKGRFNPS
jgi:hypothetical protein